MGLRGPGAKSRVSGPSQGVSGDHPWNRENLSDATRIILFIESLNVTSGALAGKPFRLLPFQRDAVNAWYETDKDGNRIVRKGLLSIARKNGKTGLTSALALAHLAGPMQEKRGQIVVGAADRDQSGLIFNEIEAFINDSVWLQRECNIKRHEKVIEHLPSGSVFRACSSDARKAHGLSPSVVILDELAQWGDSERGRGLYDALTTAGGARKNPLVIIIGTQAAEDHSLMSQLVDYSVDGGDPKFRGFVYQIPADADVWDESTWLDANPALGFFRSVEDMQELAQQARKLPSLENTFRNLFCNQRVSMSGEWIRPEFWGACADEIDIADLAGRPCFGGIDLSQKNDLTAIVLVFPSDGRLDVLPFFWTSGADLDDKGFRDHAPYTDWVNAGYLNATPGQVVDYDMVAEKVAELAAVYDIQQVAVDRYRSDEFEKSLQKAGVSLDMFGHGQGFKDMGPAIEALEDAVLSRELRHSNHPIMNWCLKNVQIVTDPAANRKFDKKKATGRIDGVQALAMACHASAIYGGEFIYRDRGFISL